MAEALLSQKEKREWWVLGSRVRQGILFKEMISHGKDTIRTEFNVEELQGPHPGQTQSTKTKGATGQDLRMGSRSPEIGRNVSR